MAELGGIYRGTILNTADPLQQGRVQVMVPAAGATAAWAMPCRPTGSPAQRPMQTQAEIGGGCWVMFEAGDPHRPVLVGVL